jgi:FixJ family two-component response regulator
MNEPTPVIYIVDDDDGVRQALSSLFRSVGLAMRRPVWCWTSGCRG